MVNITNFPSSDINTEFCTFEITYTSGFDPIPDDIIYAQSLLVVSEMSKQNGQDLKSYKLRERTVTFKDESTFEQFSNLL